MSSVHDGVSCDGCGSQTFSGPRFKCLRCYDFDLCQLCHSRKQYHQINVPPTNDHNESHPMQMLLTHQDFEATYAGDPSKNYDQCKIASFTCPQCAADGFNARTFVAHVLSPQGDVVPEDLGVICPLCIALPDQDSNRTVDDLRHHINQTHSQLDSAHYRTEPLARQTNRRPMLARRNQRQPASQAAGFATAPFGWTTEMGDVEEMFRLVNVNRGVPANIQALATTMGITPQGLNAAVNLPAGQIDRLQNAAAFERFAIGQSVVQQMQADFNQQQARATAIGFAGAAASSRATVQRGISEYAQPRHTTPSLSRSMPLPLPTSPVPPIARVLGVTPIHTHVAPETFQAQGFSPDDFEAYGDLSEDDDSGSDDAHEDSDNAVVDLEDGSALDDGTVEVAVVREEPLNTEANTGERILEEREGSDSEFEFDNEKSEHDSSDEEFVDVEGEQAGSSAVVPVQLDEQIGKHDIARVLRKNVTADELSTLLAVLRQECTSDSEVEDAFDADKVFKTEEGVDQQNWATMQFDIAPLSSFAMGGYWNDKRFLRQRKLHREMSAASNIEDTLEKADVALAIVRSAGDSRIGKANCGPFDRAERSMRRTLRLQGITPTMPAVQGHTDDTSVVDSREDLLVEVSRRLESESERDRTPARSPAIADEFSNAQQELGEEPASDGESSDDEDERSIRQDDVEFLDSEIRQ